MALNVGREVAPGVWFDRSTHVIHPGWVLAVPSGPPPMPVLPDYEGSPRRTSDRVVHVRPGDTLSAIASQELGDASAWSEIWEANRGRRFGDRTFDDPNLILPGWDLVVPSRSGPSEPPVLAPVAPVAGLVVPALLVPGIPFLGGPQLPPQPAEEGPNTSAESAPTAPASNPVEAAALPSPSPVATPVEAPVAVPVEVSVEASDGSHALPTGLGAATLLAGGVVMMIGRTRRRRLRSAPLLSRLAEPSSPLIRLERSLRQLSASERLARLDLAWRVACGALGSDQASTVPTVALLGQSGDVTIVLGGRTGEPPPGWTSAAPDRWTVGADVATRDLIPAMGSLAFPSPALVHVGRQGDVDVFVDVGAVGVLSIDGPEDQCGRIVRAIAASLAVSPFAERTELVLAGLELEDLPTVDGWEKTTGSGLASVPLSGGGDALVPALGNTDTVLLVRRRPLDEPWAPVVAVLVGTRQTSEAVHRLVALAQPGQGLAVVAVAGAGATWRLSRGHDGWRVEPAGIDVLPVGLEREDVEAVRSLLDAADESDEVEAAYAGSRADEPWVFLVRVLGPVDVVDRDGELVVFERAKSLELVAWLALHQGGSSRDAARTALWDMDVRASTFSNVVSEARRALGRCRPADADDDWLRRAAADHLHLHPAVISDVALLEARAAMARSLGDDDAITVLRSAVELVRGVPFDGSGYAWPDAEGMTSRVTLVVVSAVADLAERYLVGGDVAGVFWATGVGLGVLPGHEELIALRMRAHAQAGDLAGVRHEWDLYERVLAADRWAADPSPRLVELRRDLLAPSFV